MKDRKEKNRPDAPAEHTMPQSDGSNIASRELRKQQLLLSEVSNQLARLDSIEDTMKVIGKMVGSFFGVAWCMFNELTDDDRAYVISYGWNDDSLHSLTGIYRMGDFLNDEQLAANNAGKITVVNDTRTDPRVNAEEYATVGIRSFVIVPLAQDGEWRFMLSIVHNQPRRWHEEEIELVKELASRIWSRLEKARAEEALRQRETWLYSQQNAFEAEMNGKPLGISLEFLLRPIIEQSKGKARAAFYAIPAEGEGLHWIAGMNEAYAKDVKSFKVAPESLACALAMQSGKPVITPDVKEEPRWKPYLSLAKDHGYRACWSFPVRIEGGPVLGTLVMYFAEPREPKAKELKLAKIMANAASMIISRHMEMVERANAQAALRKREELFKGLLNQTSVGIAKLDIAGNMTFLNDTANTMFGFEHNEGVGMSILELTADEFVSESQKLFLQMVREGIPFQYDKQLRRGDGTFFWASVSLAPLTDLPKHTWAAVAAIVDISARKEAEESLSRFTENQRFRLEWKVKAGDKQLKDNQVLLQKIIDSSFSFIQVFESIRNEEGKIVDFRWRLVNKKFAEAYGDMTGKTLLANNPAVIKTGIFDEMVAVVNTGESKVQEHFYNFGQFDDWFYQTVIKIDDGVILTTEKITDRKKTELALEANKDLLQATLDSTLDMIQVFKAVRNDKGKIVDFTWVLNNHASEQLYGDVIGQSLLENNPGVMEAGIFEKFVEVTETGVPQQYEKHYTYEQFNGWFRQSVVKLEDGVATTTANITARKQSEQEIQDLYNALMNKNRELASLHSELATFNNIASNDYQVTLQSLYLYLEHIIKTDAAKLSDAGKSNIRRAQSAIQKLKLLTDDIIAFYKVRYLDQNFTHVNLFKEVVVDLESKINETNATVTINEDLPQVMGFPLLLSILFHNMLDNALKFISHEAPPQIHVTWKKVQLDGSNDGAASGAFYEICIADNGIGFPEKESDKIFQIFYRLHEKRLYRGSGVGLAVCKKIMDMHGGFIKADGKPGTGATFYCYFPVV